MRCPVKRFTLLLAMLALVACGGGGAFGGDGGKSSGKGKGKKAEKKAAAADDAGGDGIADDGLRSSAKKDGAIVDDDMASGSTPAGPASASPAAAVPDPANMPAPDWAALLDVTCDFVDMVDDTHAVLRCDMIRVDGQPIDGLEIPIETAVVGPDGLPRPGSVFVDAGPGAGLGLTTSRFGNILHKVTQYVTAPVQTLASDVFHINIGTGAGSKLLQIPFITKLFDKYPIIKDGMSLALCLATSTVPAFCFVKFGLKVADRQLNGKPDSRVKVTVYQAWTGYRHYYTTDPAAPGVEGPKFLVLRDQFPGTTQLWLCLHNNDVFFISNETCDNGNGTQAGLLGYVPGGASEQTQELFRCHGPNGDQINVTNTQECTGAGYPVVGRISFVPMGDYVHTY